MKAFPKAALATVIMIVSGSSALAAPTYLTCEFPNPTGAPQVFNFAIDATARTFGVYVPASGSQRTAEGTFPDGKATLNEGTVAWEIDLANGTVIRDKRMVGEKDKGTCKSITAEQSGFEE